MFGKFLNFYRKYLGKEGVGYRGDRIFEEMQLTNFRYLVTYDADKISFPNELRKKLDDFGKVVHISGSVFGIKSTIEWKVEEIFNGLKSYINHPEDNLFIARLSSNIPSFAHFPRI